MSLSHDRIATFVRLVREHSGFRTLWTASVVSQLGDWLTYVAVSALAFTSGGGPWGVLFVFLAHMLPHAVLAPLAGPVVDRVSRRTVLFVADGVRASLSLGMAVSAATGHIVLLEVLLVLRVAGKAFAYPAEGAVLPRLVPREDLAAANAFVGLTWSVLFAAGVAVGGVLAALVGPVWVILVDAGTFVISAVLHARLPELLPDEDGSSRRPGSSPLGQAVALVRARPDVASAVLAKAPLALSLGGGWITLNLVALDGEGGPEAAAGGVMMLGLLHAVRAAGTGVGPLLGRKEPSGPEALLFSDVVTCLAVVLFALVTHPLLLVAASFAWGAGSGRNWVVSQAALQARAPGAFLGRLGAMDLFLTTAAQAAAAVVGTVLVVALGSAAVAGVTMAVVGLVVVIVVRLATTPHVAARLSSAQRAATYVHREVERSAAAE